jgi:hypothetical protein
LIEKLRAADTIEAKNFIVITACGGAYEKGAAMELNSKIANHIQAG